MWASEAAHRSGVSVKALRYYEALGLIEPERLPNGYRIYDELDLRILHEIVELKALGFKLEATRPFLESIRGGNDSVADCTECLDAYAEEIRSLDQRIRLLLERRAGIRERLHAAGRWDSNPTHIVPDRPVHPSGRRRRRFDSTPRGRD